MRFIFLILALILFNQGISSAAVTAMVDNSYYNSFSNGIRLKSNNDKILVCYRKGIDHVALDASGKGSNAVVLYSISSGTTSSEQVIYTDSVYDMRDCSLGEIYNPNTGVYTIYAFASRRCYSGGCSGTMVDWGYMKSTDGGVTWSTYNSVFTNDGIYMESFNGRGSMIDSNTAGTYYMPFFGHEEPTDTNWEVRLIGTTDYGATWDQNVLVYTGTTKLGEPAFAHVGNGEMFGLFRNNANGVLRYSSSRDNGATWTTPVVSNIGGTNINIPFINYDKNYDDVIISYHDRQSSGSAKYITSTRAKLALSGATVFGSPTTLDTGYTANGYPWNVRISDTQVMFGWDKQTASDNADIMYDIVNIGTANQKLIMK